MNTGIVFNSDTDVKLSIPLQFGLRRINGHLKTVMDTHIKYGASFRIIIENLWGMIQYRTAGYADHPFNPYLTFMRRIKGKNIASGMTVDERLYRDTFEELYKEKPSNIINQLFYYGKADDTCYETHITIDTFISQAVGELLIANPTPDSIKYLASLNRNDITVAVNDKALAGLYSYEFPNIHFIPYDELGRLQFDAVLLLIRNEGNQSLWKGYSVLNCISDTGLAIISAPEEVIKSPDNQPTQEAESSYSVTLKTRLNVNSLHVERIIMIPDALTQSYPKKKRLLFCRKSASEDTSILVYNSVFDKDDNVLTINHFSAIIAKDMLWFPQQSLKTAYGIQFRKAQSVSSRHYSTSQTYEYSPEIRFRYTMYEGKKNKRVRAVLLNHSTGKRITDEIEKGLASSSIEQARCKIEQLPYRKSVQIAILSDLVKDSSKETIRLYSLKTLWYMHRQFLLGIPSYDDSFCMDRIFNHNMRHFSSIFPYKALSFNDYLSSCTADIQFIPDEEKFWKQMGIILSYLSGKLYLTNPISTFLQSGNNKNSSGVQSGRNAIVVRSFTKDQSLKIWKYITEKDKDGYLYKKDSLRILVAIRFATGLPLAEILALDWGHLLVSETYNCHMLYITGRVDNNGLRLLYSDVDPDQARIVPIPHELFNILDNRRKYLENKYPAASDNNTPIILNCEPKSKNKKEFTRLSVSSGTNLFRRVKNMVSDGKRSVELEASGIETDYAKYGGDLFNKNHEFHALENGSNSGSLKSMYGVSPLSTVEYFYIDYENEAILSQTAETLSRWICSLIKPNKNHSSTDYLTIQGMYKDTIRFSNQAAAVRLTLGSANSEDDEDIFVSIDSSHAATVNIR